MPPLSGAGHRTNWRRPISVRIGVSLSRLVPIIAITCMLIGCGPDVQEQAARTYVTEMTPLLEDNHRLARTLLQLAEKIKYHRTTPQKVADQFDKELIPAARSLAERAQSIQPEQAPLNGIHQDLVRAWSNRQKAYVAMHAAWVDGDLAAYEAKAESHKTVFKAEARYFMNVNKTLSEYQLTLEQYP